MNFIEAARIVEKDLELFKPSKFNKTVSLTKKLPWGGASGNLYYHIDPTNENFKKIHARVAIKVCFYNKTANEIYCDKESKISMTEASFKVLETLKSEFAENHRVCCMLPSSISSKKFKLSDFANSNYLSEVKEFSGNDIHARIALQRELVKSGIANDGVRLMLVEKNIITLHRYILAHIKPDHIHTDENLKILLIQIIYLFWSITKKYPKFRHNDLHLNNILLRIRPDILFNKKTTSRNPQRYYEYEIDDNHKYCVPSIGLYPIVIDFDYSILPEKNINNPIMNDKDRVFIPNDNDICYLFTHIQCLLDNNGEGFITNRISQLLESIDTKKTFKRYNRIYLSNNPDQVTTLDEMIRSDAWKCFGQDITNS